MDSKPGVDVSKTALQILFVSYSIAGSLKTGRDFSCVHHILGSGHYPSGEENTGHVTDLIKVCVRSGSSNSPLSLFDILGLIRKYLCEKLSSTEIARDHVSYSRDTEFTYNFIVS